jgi:hypothetical protein
MAVLRKNEDDLGTILANKLKEHEKALREHESQLTFHQKESAFHRERVDYIKNILKDLPPLDENNGAVIPELTDEEKYTKSWFWKQLIKEKAPSYLQNKEFGRGNILSLEVIPNPDDKEYKGSVGYAASIALSELTKEGFLSFRKELGIKGYLYKVKKIN